MSPRLGLMQVIAKIQDGTLEPGFVMTSGVFILMFAFINLLFAGVGKMAGSSGYVRVKLVMTVVCLAIGLLLEGLGVRR